MNIKIKKIKQTYTDSPAFLTFSIPKNQAIIASIKLKIATKTKTVLMIAATQESTETAPIDITSKMLVASLNETISKDLYFMKKINIYLNLLGKFFIAFQSAFVFLVSGYRTFATANAAGADIILATFFQPDN